MKKGLVMIAIFGALLLAPAAPSFAGHRHYPGCNHYGGYAVAVPVYYPDYWHSHYVGSAYLQCHYYGGIHHYARAYPAYRTYRHSHYYRGSYYRGHFYGGHHHFTPYYRPRVAVQFGFGYYR